MKKVPWTPFEPCEVPPPGAVRTMIGNPTAIWKNSRYTVAVYEREGTPMGDITHLSIKRNDKEPIHDWRDLQRIKNELCGRNREGFELYPCEARIADTSNQYHLWVMSDGNLMPVGFFDGRIVAEGDQMGAKQRPFEDDVRPTDLLTFPDRQEDLPQMKPELERRKQAMFEALDPKGLMLVEVAEFLEHVASREPDEELQGDESKAADLLAKVKKVLEGT